MKLEANWRLKSFDIWTKWTNQNIKLTATANSGRPGLASRVSSSAELRDEAQPMHGTDRARGRSDGGAKSHRLDLTS